MSKNTTGIDTPHSDKRLMLTRAGLRNKIGGAFVEKSDGLQPIDNLAIVLCLYFHDQG